MHESKTPKPATMSGRRSSALWPSIGFWICIVIALAAAVRRLIALARPSQSGPPSLLALDRLFESHRMLTIAHIVPAMGFVALCPLVFLRKERLYWAEWWLFPLGAITGLTAYAMSSYAVGGWTERSAVLVFNTIFLLSLVRSYIFMRRNQEEQKSRWLLRAVVVLLGIATTRPVMGIFFATSPLTHLTPSQFFGIAFWIGFSINWIAVETWLCLHGTHQVLAHDAEG